MSAICFTLFPLCVITASLSPRAATQFAAISPTARLASAVTLSALYQLLLQQRFRVLSPIFLCARCFQAVEGYLRHLARVCQRVVVRSRMQADFYKVFEVHGGQAVSITGAGVIKFGSLTVYA